MEEQMEEQMNEQETEQICIDDGNTNVIIEYTCDENMYNEELVCIKDIDYSRVSYIRACELNISSFAWLQASTTLTDLKIFDNNITSLDGIQGCINLIILDISGNKISSLCELAELTKLIHIDAYNNEITSLNGLNNMVNLKYFSISSNKITSLTEIQNCTVLNELYASENQIQTIEGINRCTGLEILDVSNNNIRSINITNGLKECINLRELDIYSCNLYSLDGLQDCINLEHLTCNSNNITSLDGLENCPALNILYCRNNNIDSLNGIQGCINLNILYVGFNMLTSLDGLENNINLRSLDISHNIGITTLPNFIIEFVQMYSFIYNGLELELEPRMRRWLNRIQLPTTQYANGLLYNNNQNVHDSSIQETVRDSMRRLLNQKHIPKLSNATCLETLSNQIILDQTLTPKSKDQLLSYISTTSTSSNEELVELSLTYGELFWVVWQTIHSPYVEGENTFDEETQIQIKQILNQELEDSDCKCFTGRMSRLVNVLNGFSPLVEVKILESTQIANILTIIRNRLNESDEGYTVEKHKEEFKKEMLDRGESMALINEWCEYIE